MVLIMKWSLGRFRPVAPPPAATKACQDAAMSEIIIGRRRFRRHGG
jgi:hypothetical protein